MKLSDYVVKPNSKINLSKINSDLPNENISKEYCEKILGKNIIKLSELQEKLYAENKYALLLIFQGMDASGKDSLIKHVMSGLNPQGTQVYSFKEPSKEELDHDYLWRIHKAMPERGRIGIFNRSHYEEVLIVRIHNLISKQGIPERLISKNIWNDRYRQINDFERYMSENGTIILKFFLHISHQEQKKRFLKRIDDQTKNWKFSYQDIKERSFWNRYMAAYQEALSSTSTKYAQWYIIPSDKKWYARTIVSEIIVQTLKKLKLSFPEVSAEQLEELKRAKEILLQE
jgi:PPK2 family polyphosphate:nucleotide phosphotransferase